MPLEAVARGEDDRPLVPLRPPLVLTAQRTLDWALADWTALTTLLRQLLAAPLATLQRQGLGATRVALMLGREAGDQLALTLPLAAPTSAAAPIVDQLSAALPAALANAAADAGGIVAVTLTLTAPRPLVGRQTSFFDVPQGQRGRVLAGVAEARRREAGRLGHWRPVDLAHPLPERRYALDETTLLAPPDRHQADHLGTA